MNRIANSAGKYVLTALDWAVTLAIVVALVEGVFVSGHHDWFWPAIGAAVAYMVLDTAVDAIRARRRDRANQAAAIERAEEARA